jgi:hypothetical protein
MENPKRREVKGKVLAAHFSKMGTTLCLSSGNQNLFMVLRFPLMVDSMFLVVDKNSSVVTKNQFLWV